ncbi:MAG: hypothetical protein AAGK04_08400 [Planctomycetota bacterium]
MPDGGVPICPSCGYDLAGHLAEARDIALCCPECGAALEWRAVRVTTGHREDTFQVDRAPTDPARRSLRRFESAVLILIFAVVLLTPLIMWIVMLVL